MPSNSNRAFIGIGSNLCDPLFQVRSAIKAIAQAADISLEQTSSLYLSPPMGPPDQPNYVNAVAMISTFHNSYQLLTRLQGIERDHGRIRSVKRWGPRTLDLDILLFGTESIDTETLRIPHEGLTERPFVVVPLSEIAPDLILPNGECVSDLAARMQSQTLTRLPDA